MQIEMPFAIRNRSYMLNRLAPVIDFRINSEGWFQVLKIGEWPHTSPKRNGRGEIEIDEQGKQIKETYVQVCDREACEAIVAKFNEERGSVPNWGGMLLDFDHFSYDPDKSTEAAGWIDEMEVRNDGVWCKPRFSSVGKDKVDGAVYRFVSPVLENFDNLGGNRIRPRRMDSAGLTNRPNIWGMVPWANRSAADSGKDAVRNSDAAGEKLNMDHKKLLCSLLGLGAEATDEQITTAVDAAKGKKTEVETEIAAKNREIAALKTDVAGLTTKLNSARQGRINQLVEENKDTFDEVELRNRLTSDFEGTEALLVKRVPKDKKENRGTEGKEAKGAGYKPLHNRDNGNHPNSPDGEEGSMNAEREAAAITKRMNEIMRGDPRCNFNVAWNRAKDEVRMEWK